MKNVFLKFGLFLAFGLSTAVFYSCSKDKDDNGIGGDASKIIATNVMSNASSEIVTVKVEVHWHDEDGEYHDDVIAQAPFRNNGFTLQLPTMVPDKYLKLLEYHLYGSYAISDRQAKTLVSFPELDICAYDKDDNHIGYVWLADNKRLDDGNWVEWVYIDRDVTITMEYSEEYNDIRYTDKMNLNLKKGWNVAYHISTEYTWTFTTQKPSGVTFNWYAGYSDGWSAKANLKSTAKKN
ncbi:MAG: hypothetical protein LBH91_04605 [Prevotellaceae bacterium]|jgi:hypothetical protein|nr:hypothetical protein [Prevotellaceae bacterium]